MLFLESEKKMYQFSAVCQLRMDAALQGETSAQTSLPAHTRAEETRCNTATTARFTPPPHRLPRWRPIHLNEVAHPAHKWKKFLHAQ